VRGLRLVALSASLALYRPLRRTKRGNGTEVAPEYWSKRYKLVADSCACLLVLWVFDLVRWQPVIGRSSRLTVTETSSGPQGCSHIVSAVGHGRPDTGAASPRLLQSPPSRSYRRQPSHAAERKDINVGLSLA